jgi:hypothetical protein
MNYPAVDSKREAGRATDKKSVPSGRARNGFILSRGPMSAKFQRDGLAAPDQLRCGDQAAPIH